MSMSHRRRNRERSLSCAGLIAFGFLALSVASQARTVTSNALSRVVQIAFTHKHSDGMRYSHQGSAFTIEVDGDQYLISAAHVLHGTEGEVSVEAFVGGGWREVSGRAIYCGNRDVDVVALTLESDLTGRPSLEPTMGGISISQQVFFLGYPFGLATRGPSIGTVPFVKAGILSAVDNMTKDRVVLYVDAHSNPRFSGGPVIFYHEESGKFRIAGVVQGYRHEYKSLLQQVPKPKGGVDRVEVPGFDSKENTGILIGYSIEHIIDAIKSTNEK